MTEQEERNLIFLAQQGHKKAFLELYQAYDRKIEIFAYSRIHSQQDAEDLIAEIWEKILLHLKNFKGEFTDSFKSWIFTIARNSLINFYKRSSSHKENLDIEDVENLIFYDFDKEDFFQSKELYSAVKKLPEQQAQTIKLKYFEDFKNKEIAEKLDVSEKTVASNLSRALKKLFKIMQ